MKKNCTLFSKVYFRWIAASLLLLMSLHGLGQEPITHAFSFGGAASAGVKEMRYGSDGNLYFAAQIGTKFQFAGTNYDIGGYNGYPYQMTIFGKVGSNGQQTLLNKWDGIQAYTFKVNTIGNDFAIDKDGGMISYLGGTWPGNDYGNGFVETGYGAKLIKVDKNGTVQWVKPVNTGRSLDYGSNGITLPNCYGLQVMDDGSIYSIVQDFNAVTDGGDPRFGKFLSRIIRFNSNGDEVWHHEIVRNNATGTWLSAPKQFVDNNGNSIFQVTLNAGSSFATAGTVINGTEPYNGWYSWIVALDNNGARTWYHESGVASALRAVDPATGIVYLKYGNSANKPSAIFPYSTLPNYSPFPNQYGYVGLLKLNIGNGSLISHQSYSLIAEAKKFLNGDVQVQPNGSLLFYNYSANADPAGDYIINGHSIIFTDNNYNISKLYQTPVALGKVVAASNTNFAVTGTFKIPVTIGGISLTPFTSETDFDTKYPAYVAAKADAFVALGNISQIPPPKTSHWTGAASTAWNNAANWSNGVPDAGTTAIFDANVANQPVVAAATTVGRVVINSGVTASLPATNLTIKTILSINGTLKVAVNGFVLFNSGNALATDGTGTIEFAGTSGSVSIISKLSSQLNLKTNVPVSVSATFNSVFFGGANAKITGDIVINNADVNAISGAGATSYIQGKLTRKITAGATYSFPVGSVNYYLPVSINTNNIAGTNSITVQSKTDIIATPDVSIGGTTIHRATNNGNWVITPDQQPTSGTYHITLNKSNATNGDADASKYVVLSTTPQASSYGFEGSLGSRSQTGGTGSGANFQNSQIAATQNDLEKFGDLIIAVAAGALSEPLTTTTSTWTGAANNDWNNAANWNSGVPESNVHAIIPSGLVIYPLVYNQVKSHLKSLTVDAGANVNLSDRLIVSGTITNNGTITINTTPNANSALPVRSLLTGNGKVVFEKPKSLTDAQPHTGQIGCDLEINIGDANTMNINGVIGGNIRVISGMPSNTSLAPVGQVLTLPNASSTMLITAPVNYIAARVKRAITENGTFDFPIGNLLTSSYTGGRKYGAITITNHGVANTKQYEVLFDGSTTSVFKPFQNGNDIIGSFLNSGFWSITPDVVSATGTIDLILKTSDYTNGRADVNDYVLVRENNTAGAWMVVANAVITESAGMVTVVANGLPALSTTGETRFYIGLKASVSTWTGAANNGNWNTASNWNNGIPSTSMKAVFDANASNFPTVNIPAGNGPAAVEVKTGAALALPVSFYTPVPFINNGTIEVQGAGTFYGFGNGSNWSVPTGNGVLKFSAVSPNVIDGYYVANTFSNSLEINNPAGVTISRTLNLQNNLTLTSGIVAMAPGQTINITNPNAVVTGSVNAYVNGSLSRIVSNNGVYEFPIGITGTFAPATVTLHNVSGTTSISAAFSNAALSNQPNLTVGSATITQALSTGSWTITPNIPITGGSYDISLSAPSGGSTAGSFAAIKREGNYSFYNWTIAGSPKPSSVNAGVVTATAKGISSFSQFAIAEVMGVLPVQLVRFTAQKQNTGVALHWLTSSEQNSAYFDIERKGNSGDFVKVGTVKAIGNSHTGSAYAFTDAHPLTGLNYYRLKQVDADNGYAYTGIRAVNFDGRLPNALALYPLPASANLMIDVPGEFEGEHVLIKILSGDGKVVKQSEFNVVPGGAPIGLNVSSLPAGAYYLTVSSGSKKVSRIFLKQ